MTLRTKRIPIAETVELQDALNDHHEAVHLPAGLHRFNGPRRELVDRGIKGIKIAEELQRRGMVPTPCRFCLPDSRLVRNDETSAP